MRIYKKYFFTVLTFLFGVFDAIAIGPPSPMKKPPKPPKMPIDENIYILILIAILFGIYIIYNHRLKTKTPI